MNHYYFNVTNGVGNAAFTATATLVWNRQQNKTGINNLDLFLYNAANSNLVAVSTSPVDNVEHIFVPTTAQGRYDLQVLEGRRVHRQRQRNLRVGVGIFLPVVERRRNPARTLFSMAGLSDRFCRSIRHQPRSAGGLEQPNNPVPTVTNNQNFVLLNATNRDQFFRLQRP